MRGKWVFVVLFVWPYFFNQQSVEAVPYGYVVTGSASEQRGQKVILHTVDFETKKIIKSTVLLTNRLAPNIVDISQNPREVGLIVMSGSWGEGKSSQMELNLLDLQNMTIKKKTFIGGGREMGGGVVWTYPANRALYTDGWKKVSLSPQFEVKKTEPTGWPVAHRGDMQDPVVYFSRTSAQALRNDIESMDLSSGVSKRWLVDLPMGWRLANGMNILPLKHGERFLISCLVKGEAPNLEDKLVIGQVEGNRIKIVKEMNPVGLDRMKFSPDHKKIYGLDIHNANQLVVFNCASEKIQPLFETKTLLADPTRKVGWPIRLEVTPDGQFIVLLFTGIHKTREDSPPGYMLIYEVGNGKHWMIDLPAGSPVGIVFDAKK